MNEIDWDRVLEIRCRAKRGESLTPDDTLLIRAAFTEDPIRYRDLNEEVFNSTVPVGSTARWRK